MTYGWIIGSLQKMAPNATSSYPLPKKLNSVFILPIQSNGNIVIDMAPTVHPPPRGTCTTGSDPFFAPGGPAAVLLVLLAGV